MIGKRIVHQVALAEAGSKQCARQAPVVRSLGLGLIHRARGGENPHDVAKCHRCQTPERRLPMLQLDEPRFARHR